MCKVTKNIFKGKDVLFVSKKTFVFSFLLKFAFDCCMYLRGFCLWSWLELLLRPFHAFVQNIRKLIIFSRFLKCHFVWKWKFFLFFKIKNETFLGDLSPTTTICYAPLRILNSTAEITSHHHFGPQVNCKLYSLL